MVKLSRGYYERETARLRRAHSVGIALAHRFNTDNPPCLHGTGCPGHRTFVVTVALDLCATVRRDLAYLKQIGYEP